MGYGSIAKGLASTVGNTALDAVPGGKAVKGLVKGIKSLLGGGGNKWDKSLKETRAAGKAGDVATLQFKLANTKYPQVAKSAKAYLDVLMAKSTGSRSDGWLMTKTAAPVLVAGAGPMSSAQSGVSSQGSQSLPLPSPASRRRRRKRRSSYRSHSRKSRGHSRKSRSGKKRRTSTHRKRKLKFGSRKWRMKYLGHK